MLLEAPGTPLRLRDLATPRPAAGQVLIEVEACAVCRTDLHVIDAELPDMTYPLIPGHQIVGRVVEGDGEALHEGDRVGVPWLGQTCGVCDYCRSERENLCDSARFTGYTLPGGYAEYVVADARFCFPIDAALSPVAAAPLLCAGLIGYRALRMCGDARSIGLFGFGAAAHQLAQVLRHRGCPFHAFTRAGDASSQAAALELGAQSAGASEEARAQSLDAAIIFAPAGELVPLALRSVRKGGRVICAGIHMSDIPAFPYAILWGERRLQSVANLTRQDGLEFLRLASEIGLKTATTCYALEEANEALADLRSGAFTGSAVLELARPPSGRAHLLQAT